jgi:hypothetical protein
MTSSYLPSDPYLCRVCLEITTQPIFIFEEIDSEDITLLDAVEIIANLEVYASHLKVTFSDISFPGNPQ